MSDNIQSVDRALELLIYLQNEGKETSVTKIANDMGIYKSTVHRTLMTLESKGFVSRNPETGKGSMGRMARRRCDPTRLQNSTVPA